LDYRILTENTLLKFLYQFVLGFKEDAPAAKDKGQWVFFFGQLRNRFSKILKEGSFIDGKGSQTSEREIWQAKM